MTEPGDQDVIDRFAALKVWSRGDHRAPHKALLLLHALARLQRGEDRLISFAELEEPLGQLLRGFGPPRNRYYPRYTFWHMQREGLWDIPRREELVAELRRSKQQDNPPKRVLLESEVEGGLDPELYAHLRTRPDLVECIAARLLEASFPPSIHQTVLDAVGMPWPGAVTSRRRDDTFHDAVLRIYQHRCAVCGYDGRLGDTDLGIEAAHIKWRAAGGPSAKENGFALCSFHHEMLDRGALGVDDRRRILVSQQVRGNHGVNELLLRHHGKPLRPPLKGEPPPALGFIRWHRREVFRAPSRRG